MGSSSSTLKAAVELPLMSVAHGRGLIVREGFSVRSEAVVPKIILFHLTGGE